MGFFRKDYFARRMEAVRRLFNDDKKQEQKRKAFEQEFLEYKKHIENLTQQINDVEIKLRFNTVHIESGSNEMQPQYLAERVKLEEKIRELILARRKVLDEMKARNHQELRTINHEQERDYMEFKDEVEQKKHQRFA